MRLFERVARKNEEGEEHMKKGWYSHYKYLLKHGGDIKGISRKTKKRLLGRIMNRRILKERLSLVVVTERNYPEPATISDCFCPKCGCEATRSTGNMAEYPEVWVNEFCLRCGFLVGTADNSPWISCLQFPEEKYKIL
jgi:hypothetical protein